MAFEPWLHTLLNLPTLKTEGFWFAERRSGMQFVKCSLTSGSDQMLLRSSTSTVGTIPSIIQAISLKSITMSFPSTISASNAARWQVGRDHRSLGFGFFLNQPYQLIHIKGKYFVFARSHSGHLYARESLVNSIVYVALVYPRKLEMPGFAEFLQPK